MITLIQGVMEMGKREYQVCANCVMDTSDSKIQFDSKGYCDHCNNFYKNILPNWHPDEASAKELEIIVERIKKEGKNKPYDCIIGLSGGVDSSYLTYIAKENWASPTNLLCRHRVEFDVAVENIARLVKGLDIDIYRGCRLGRNERSPVGLF